MKKIVLFFLVIAFSVPASANMQCGVKPVRPIPPVGCRDLVAECICEQTASGNVSCRWVWRCVK